MREIPDEILDLIAGGMWQGQYEASMPTVSVVGYYYYGDWGGGGGGGGSGGYEPGSQSVSAAVSAPAEVIDVHTSPAPPVVPTDVDLNKLRNTILSVAAEIAALDASIEHGAIIVRAPDGTLRVGEIAHGTFDSISMNIGVLPGEVIVSYIHSHPYGADIKQTLPSKYDFDQAADLRAMPIADKGMLLYILDNESGDVFEYHAENDRNTKREGANITDDIKAP